MKKIFIILFISIPFCSLAQNTLEGKITDKITNESLIGAIIYFPDLKTGTVSDANGNYKISNLPKGKFLVQVKFLGYSISTESIDLATTRTKDFAMEASATEAKEVVITGNAFATDNSRNSISLATMDKIKLKTQAPTNFINALTSLPGISSVTTGGAVSKPVIRGLGYNHVIVLSEGVRQEGNQWGDEHGTEIDQFAVDRVEILKGPASLFYGSDAMGGVINTIEPIPASIGTISGEAATNYSTNSKLSASSIAFQGNQNGFVWRARGTYKSAAAYQTPTEYVYNSGFSETNANAMLGLNKKWGYSHLFISQYNAKIGAIEAERDSATGQFVNTNREIVTGDVLRGRSLDVPFQHIVHNKISSVNNFIVKEGQLKINLGYQTNTREEFGESKDTPGLSFLLTTFTGDAKYQFPVKNKLEAVVGASGMLQGNENKGVEFLVPDYNLQDMGGFVYLKKSFERYTINAGIRVDNRFIKSKNLFLDSLSQPSESGDTLFRSFERNMSAITGALGFTYNFSKEFNIKANLGRGFRAPNIAELGSNGVHEGTFRYEIGNNQLKPETSLQLDAEISFEANKWNLTLGGFYNLIDQFIYKRNINNEMISSGGELFPVYRYVQGKSLLKGFEVSIDIHPIEQIHFENTLSLVQGTNMDTNAPLPFIPATHTSHELRWNINIKNKIIKNPYVKVGLNYYFKQDRFDLFETETGSYTLLNIGIGTEIKIVNQLATLFVTANNIADVKYYDHLSRLKEESVYNMGRNISFGINVPFGIK